LAAATPIPTLIPAYLAAPTVQVGQPSFGKGQCEVYALDVVGAWVKAGKPETASFEISGQEGKICLAGFEKDVLPLFTEPNIWYSGSLACASCHNANLELAAAQMALNNYQNILAGSRRTSATQPGTDILGRHLGESQAVFHGHLPPDAHRPPHHLPRERPDGARG
jgi:hypothetical protein